MKKITASHKNLKKSQSEIISSILLILLVLAAAAIISGVVLSIVRERLSESDCLDVSGKIDISPDYTCYNADTKEMQVQAHIGKIRDLIDGFAIEMGGADTRSYRIINGTTLDQTKMCDQSLMLIIPKDNEAKTYLLNTTIRPSSINIYPILKGGKLCGASDTITSVPECVVESKKCTH